MKKFVVMLIAILILSLGLTTAVSAGEDCSDDCGSRGLFAGMHWLKGIFGGGWFENGQIIGLAEGGRELSGEYGRGKATLEVGGKTLNFAYGNGDFELQGNRGKTISGKYLKVPRR